MTREAGRGRALPSLLLAAASAALLSLAAGGGGGGALQRSLGKIAGGLRGAVDDLPQGADYSEWRPTARYESEGAEFRPAGMGGLYNLTEAFVGWVVPGDVLFDGLIRYDRAGRPSLNDNVDPKEVLAYYWGILAVCCLLLLAVVLFPLCGLFVCCCRCCGRCGGRAGPAGKRKDACRKVAGGLALIGLMTAMLFCVVCALGSNQQLQRGLDDFGNNMEKSVNDVDTFLGSVVDETQYLLVNNYQEFADVFFKTLQSSSNVVMESLEELSNATAMMDLIAFTNNLPNIEKSIEDLKDGTNVLRVYASQLNDAMRKVKNDLMNTLSKCKIPECNDIRNQISNLQTQVDFNKLPDMSEELSTLDSINISQVAEAAQAGNKSLSDVNQHISETLKMALDDTSAAIDSAAKTINSTLADMRKTLDDTRRGLRENVRPQIDTLKRFNAEYRSYGNYVGIAVGTALLLVALCLALGLVCGVCGKRPDGYTDNCCNKGAGARFLICGVALMFLTGAVIAALSLALFLAGVTVDKGPCAVLKDPSASPRMSKLIDSVDLSPLNVTITRMLSNCRANSSAYRTFDFSKVYDIDELRKKFDIDDYLDGLDVSGVLGNGDFEILSEGNKDVLRTLKVQLSAQSDKFSDELTSDFVNVNLDDLTSQLRNLTNKVANNPDPAMQGIVGDLQLSLLHLDTYNEKILTPMKARANQVVETAKTLDIQLKMNKTSFDEAIDALLDEIDSAEQKLKTQGSELLTNITDEFVGVVKSQVNSYLDRVINNMRDEVGRCGPLSNVLDATLVNSCDKIVTPLNGLWFSYLCAVILFAITIIVSIMVASLYQKYKQYGQYVETEYLYDAYAEHGDAVPLNSRSKHRPPKKSAKKKVKRYEDRSGAAMAGGDNVLREYGPQGPPDARYADMAPKHWEDFPNGGPPQYQRAPMEYERPPPYYYPAEGAPAAASAAVAPPS